MNINKISMSPSNLPRSPVCTRKGKKKKSPPRKILKKGATVSLGDDCGYNLKERSIFHANRRLELFFLDCILTHNSAVRTDGTTFDPKTRIGFTSLQGDSCEVKGFHASHSNTGAVFDQIFPEYLEQIKNEEKVTPKKKEQLKRIGLTEKQLKILIDPSINKKEHSRIINLVKKQRSYIYNTTFEESMNLTVALPRDSNLMIDMSIENYVRENFLCQTLSKVMRGELVPEKATKQYKKVIKEQLELLAASIDPFELKFNEAYEVIQQCIKIEMMKKIDTSIAKVYCNHVIRLKELLRELQGVSTGVLQFGLGHLKSTIQSLTGRVNKKRPIDPETYLKRVRTLWKRSQHPTGFSLHKETFEQVESVKSRIVKLRNMISYQIAGTKVPKFEKLLSIEGGNQKTPQSNIKQIKRGLFL